MRLAASPPRFCGPTCVQSRPIFRRFIAVYCLVPVTVRPAGPSTCLSPQLCLLLYFDNDPELHYIPCDTTTSEIGFTIPNRNGNPTYLIAYVITDHQARSFMQLTEMNLSGDISWEVLSHMMFLGTPLLLHTYTYLST